VKVRDVLKLLTKMVGIS